MGSNIKTFQDLYAWQEARKLVLIVYSETSGFPPTEDYALTNQMRRASVSVTSNVAEGFSRLSNKDKRHFYSLALGSLTELQNQMAIAKDLDYIPLPISLELERQSVVVHKLINGLIIATNKDTSDITYKSHTP